MVAFSSKTFDSGTTESEHQLTAPMPGKIKGFFVKVGDRLVVGQKVLVMEAMKMENIIHSRTSGRVAKVWAKDGDTVAQGQILLEIK